MAFYKIRRSIGSIKKDGRAIQVIYKERRVVWLSELQCCFANGIWMDKYPWLDNCAWSDK